MPDVYKAITLLMAPQAIAFLVTIFFSSYSPIGIGNMSPFLSVLTGVIFFVAIPSFSIVIFSRKDLHLKDRKGRNIPYLLTIISYVIASLIYWSYGSKVMFILSISYVIVSSTLALINIFTKVSAHAAGFMSPVTALVYVFGTNMIPLYSFVFFIYLSKLKLKAHTPVQLVLGTIIGVILTSITYELLW